MKPIVIYPPAEAARNAFAIEKFRTLLGAEWQPPNYDGEAAYVINRSNDYRVAERFEHRGIRVFNAAAFSCLANDKQRCYDFMEAHGIPILPTRVSTPPFVKKPRNGHGGDGVVWCRCAEEYDAQMVCQQPASETGKDLRVWILGGEIAGAMLRTSATDFRANFCLGGTATPYTLNDTEKHIIKKIISLVSGDYYGIDFLFHHGMPVFNELEDSVGARMLYAKTKQDILAQYCAYIQSVMGGKYSLKRFIFGLGFCC